MRAGIARAAVFTTLLLVVASGCGSSERAAVTKKTTTEPVTHTTANERVYVPEIGGDTVYKPGVIGASVDGGAIYYVARWRSYGGSVAIADAYLSANDCKPSCAEGHHHEVEMELRLSRRVPCRGVVAYGRMSIQNAGDPRYEGSVALSDFCTAGG